MVQRASCWSEGTIDTLEDIERKVDAQHVFAGWGVGRQGIECGDRARLGEPERSRGINGPLGILRRSIVCCDGRTQPGQGTDLLISQACFLAAIMQLAALRATVSRSADNNSLIAQVVLEGLTCSGVDDK